MQKYTTNDEGNGGGEGEWEWDGVPVEGAQDSEFDSIDNTNDVALVLSLNFMSMASLVSSPVGGGGGGVSTFDPFLNAGKIHQLFNDEGKNDASK